MKKTLFLTTALVFSGHMAFSATVAEQVTEQLRVDGFQNIEVAERDGTVKVEGERGELKVEAVYDSATGEKLKEEIGRTDDDRDITVSGDDDGTDDQGSGNDDDSSDDDNGGDDDGGDDNGRDGGGDDNGGDDGGDDNGGDRDGDSGGDSDGEGRDGNDG